MRKQVELVTSMRNAVEEVAIQLHLEVKNVSLTRILQVKKHVYVKRRNMFMYTRSKLSVYKLLFFWIFMIL